MSGPHFTRENAAEYGHRGGAGRKLVAARDRLASIPTGLPVKPEHLAAVRAELDRIEGENGVVA